MARCPWPHKRHYSKKGESKAVMLKMQRRHRQAFVYYECRNCGMWLIARKHSDRPVQNAEWRHRHNKSKYNKRRRVP